MLFSLLICRSAYLCVFFFFLCFWLIDWLKGLRQIHVRICHLLFCLLVFIFPFIFIIISLCRFVLVCNLRIVLPFFCFFLVSIYVSNWYAVGEENGVCIHFISFVKWFAVVFRLRISQLKTFYFWIEIKQFSIFLLNCFVYVVWNNFVFFFFFVLLVAERKVALH